ncbi:hypothetical protein [uncultured Muribaculum sp.]|nr:hypothetical protein [uncultured Muribaculum sp.]
MFLMSMCFMLTACGSSIEQILDKPTSEVSPEDVTRLIGCIEEINVPAQEHMKARAWGALISLVDDNQEKFDLAARCYAKLNTLGPDQLVDTSAHEVMQQFAALVSELAAHKMLSASAF